MDYKSYSRRLVSCVVLTTFLFVGPVWAQDSSSTTDNGSQVDQEASTTTEVDISEVITTAPQLIPEYTEESQTTSTIDPLLGEHPGEEAPESDVTVPPDESTYGQGEYNAPEVLWSNVEAASKKMTIANADYDKAIEVVRALRIRQKVFDNKIQFLQKESQNVLDQIASIEESIQARAIANFLLSGTDIEGPPGINDGIDEDIENLRMNYLLELDSADIEDYQDLKSELDSEAREVFTSKKLIDDLVTSAEEVADSYKVEADQAQIEFEAFEAGSQVYVKGVVFPIAGDYSIPLIDSYGFPRMPGTSDAHWHEGIDIFAPRGTPLVSAERGVVIDVGRGRLGGLKLWIKGESGTEWYYAHLHAFTTDLHEGQLVEAGDLLGYVGDTGNAVGTPPHLHLEMHPGGGGPVNPYPLLNIVSEKDQQKIETDGSLEYEHKPLNLVDEESNMPNQEQNP